MAGARSPEMVLGEGDGYRRALAVGAKRPFEGWSFADVARACDDAVRTMALDDREDISERDVVLELEELKRRSVPARS